ncbi:MAG: hypothetical protein JXR97_08895, partial [Planctomycetes bacterium]|nr:hypothetical protein [Planctomycetota bacterium]
MDGKSYVIEGRQAILHVRDHICTSSRDLLQSSVFVEILRRYMKKLNLHESPLRKPFLAGEKDSDPLDRALELVRILSGVPLDQAAEMLPWAGHLTQPENRRAVHEF